MICCETYNYVKQINKGYCIFAQMENVLLTMVHFLLALFYQVIDNEKMANHHSVYAVLVSIFLLNIVRK